MQSILSIPLPLRLLTLFIAGSCLGALVNLGIYRLAYSRRRISPWSLVRPPIGRRTWLDRMPILGWWSLRRESPLHGAGFWIRPMLIELCFGLGLAVLYWLEVEKLIINRSLPFPGLRPVGIVAMTTIHAQVAIHVALLALMAVATFIDFDELTIPDAVTVPGTLIALVISWFCSSTALPSLFVSFLQPEPSGLTAPLRFDYPDHAAGFLAGGGSLAVALVCYLGWCFALLPRHWRLGVGVGKAWRVMWRRIVAREEYRWIAPLAVVGLLAIAAAWWRGGESWRGLVSALIGLAVGACMIWMIRVLGGIMLRREAMGFGDVTLMAMIGAFLGWQPVLIVFFLAPLAAVVVGLLQVALHRDNVIPYGPYLCLGAVEAIVFWAPIWDRTAGYFEIPWLVPSAMAICPPLLIVMLYAWSVIRSRIVGT